MQTKVPFLDSRQVLNVLRAVGAVRFKTKRSVQRWLADKGVRFSGNGRARLYHADAVQTAIGLPMPSAERAAVGLVVGPRRANRKRGEQ